MDNRKTVLLADANEEFRTMLREAIEKTDGFKIAGTTGNGAEAMHLLETLHPDLVVMDVVLPGLDGMSLLRQMKEKVSGCQRLFCCLYFVQIRSLARL